jgi:hypothetical protein
MREQDNLGCPGVLRQDTQGRAGSLVIEVDEDVGNDEIPGIRSR